MEESCIKQMHTSVLNTADILVDRKPMCCNFFIKRHFIILRVTKTRIIPRRIEKCVHRICFPFCGISTFWTGCVDKFFNCEKWILFAPSNLNILGKRYGKLFFWNWHNATFFAINYRNWRSPISLP